MDGVGLDESLHNHCVLQLGSFDRLIFVLQLLAGECGLKNEGAGVGTSTDIQRASSQLLSTHADTKFRKSPIV